MKKYPPAEKVLGAASVDQQDAIYKAYTHLSGDMPPEAFETMCARLDGYDVEKWDEIPPTDQEELTMLHIIRQIFEKGQVNISNVLQHWPTYEDRYRQLDPPPDHSGARRALQVGCYTALSAAAFAALARDIYHAEPLTIDLTSSPGRARHGDYVIGDGLHMPIDNDSIAVAQTNSLLHMLEAPTDPELEPADRASRLFSELNRVIAPGGHLIMHEIASGLDDSEHPDYDSNKSRERFKQFKTEVVTSLARAGFHAITLEPAKEIVGIDYLFDPTNDFTKYDTRERAATVVVSARKEVSPSPAKR